MKKTINKNVKSNINGNQIKKNKKQTITENIVFPNKKNQYRFFCEK